ncbi:hypothetical protein [Abyssalbus ytuae]|uniref:Uncharacterized protein n=1 Tax=Abyssalbus ytuae TaxID=2926907 RepID=A0A9E7CUW6_9FLAO|nr:hypothetical protein [Abyssalbus ytuae]UOB19062.1 hypothetical protein MQE35_07130 [Abyssalbus ytuae]
MAGSNIMLEFEGVSVSNYLLYCSNSYSTTILEPEQGDNHITFKLPPHISNKTGTVSWKLINKGKTIKENIFRIEPNPNHTVIESYFGPRSILAGGNDFSMLVVIPSDHNDNPVKDSTEVTIHSQFSTEIKTDSVTTNNLIAWKNIFSYDKSGRILVSSVCNGTTSKELTTEVYPHTPENFTVSVVRSHSYADGNQLAEFSTSVIKDRYGNIVNDGTHVEFYVKDSFGNILKTYGNTIDGIAKAKMLHPDHKEKWTVKAYIGGMANSNEITLDFLPVFSSFKAEFKNNNHTVIVGPLTSFMNQLLPDGFLVTIHIYLHNVLIETKTGLSENGFVTFNISEDLYEENFYDLTLKSGGIEQKYRKKLSHASEDKY